MHSSPTPALDRSLDHGRRLVHLAALTPALLATALAGLGAWLGKHQDWLLALLLCGLLAAVVAFQQCRRHWIERWEQVTGNTDRLRTLVSLARRSRPSDWERAFMNHTPVPPLTLGAGLFPGYRLALVVGGVLMTVLFSTASPPSDPSPLAGSSLDGPSMPGGPDSALQSSGDSATEPSRQGLQARLRELRARAAARAEASAELEQRPPTRDLARWLTGASPGPDSLPQLDPGDRAAIERAARRLRDGGELEAGQWLEQIAAGQLPPPPDVEDLAGEWRATALALSRLEHSDGMTASFEDPDRAGGGSDRAGDSSANDSSTNDGSDLSGDDTAGDNTGDMELAGDHREREGSNDGAGSARLGAHPDWLALSARPEIENRWLPVVDAYLRQSAQEEKP